MKYGKQPLSFDEQVTLLQKRGLSGDPAKMRDRLASVNYYRLSGYLYPYRIAHSDNYQSGTDFDTVWQHYAFDRRLRLLVMDAIERIEIAVRTQLAYHHSRIYNDPFAYALTPASLPHPDHAEFKHSDLVKTILVETARSKDSFVSHFKEKYGDAHSFLPVWMAVEVMSFGTMQRFYHGASHQVKKNVAAHFGMPHKVFDSWLHTLAVIRNICAHHGRLWNKELGVKPLIPLQKDYPDWHTPFPIPNNRVFGILTICRHCLSRVAPQSRWPDCVKQLLGDFPSISLSSMGFPEKWQESEVWR